VVQRLRASDNWSGGGDGFAMMPERRRDHEEAFVLSKRSVLYYSAAYLGTCGGTHRR
jgi:hypothetical protein